MIIYDHWFGTCLTIFVLIVSLEVLLRNPFISILKWKSVNCFYFQVIPNILVNHILFGYIKLSNIWVQTDGHPPPFRTSINKFTKKKSDIPALLAAYLCCLLCRKVGKPIQCRGNNIEQHCQSARDFGPKRCTSLRFSGCTGLAFFSAYCSQINHQHVKFILEWEVTGTLFQTEIGYLKTRWGKFGTHVMDSQSQLLHLFSWDSPHLGASQVHQPKLLNFFRKRGGYVE